MRLDDTSTARPAKAVLFCCAMTVASSCTVGTTSELGTFGGYGGGGDAGPGTDATSGDGTAGSDAEDPGAGDGTTTSGPADTGTSTGPSTETSTTGAPTTDDDATSGVPTEPPGTTGGAGACAPDGGNRPEAGMYSCCSVDDNTCSAGTNLCSYLESTGLGFCTRTGCANPAFDCDPAPVGSSALPVCFPVNVNGMDEQACGLSCADGETCPDGMGCTNIAGAGPLCF